MRLEYVCDRCGKRWPVYVGEVEGVPIGTRFAELVAEINDLHPCEPKEKP